MADHFKQEESTMTFESIQDEFEFNSCSQRITYI